MIDLQLTGEKGGGGSSPPPPKQTPDTLRSEDTVEVLLGICEGPIFGLENGDKSFFVGDTQLQNQNGDYNFQTFKVDFFPGEEDAQEVEPVLGGESTNNAVNLQLGSQTPVIRQTQSGDIDFIDVRLAFSRLLYVRSNGGTKENTVQLRIEYKPLSSGTWTKAYNEDLSITGKTTSTYVKEIRISVDRISEPYEIRVTKLSAENTTNFIADVAWESYQATLQENKAYDYTAIMHIVAKATDQFSSIPQWSGVYKGLLVKIPSNYNPETRVYTGTWDGTFQIAWTDNPAWCLYDFIMDDRYGIRNYYPDIVLDKYDAYDAGQWCDEMVSDGAGGEQPRYTFNSYISEARSGPELARYMAGAFNAVFFDDLDGKAYLRVDKEEDAVQIFTKENVYDGEFEYSYTDITTRYNDITVTFRNPNLNWEEDRRRVHDDTLIAKNGRIPLDFIAVGCIDDHEAVRRAYYKLLTSNTETCMVKFRTNRLGQFLNVFDTILIADPDQGYGLSGRIQSMNDDRDVLTIGRPLYLEAGVLYDITVELNDGSTVVTNIINTEKGYTTTLELAAALPENTVPDKAVFTLEHQDYVGAPRPFRITKVEEIDGNPDDFLVEAININRNKWDDADNLEDSGTISYSVLPSVFDPPGPTDVSFEEVYVRDDKAFHISVSPVFDRGAYKYYKNDHSFEVWSRLKGSTDNFVQQPLYFGDTLINHPAGLYEFKILGKSYLGTTTRLDAAPIYEFEVTNPLDPPEDVTWVKINNREVYWGYDNPPDDFAGFVVKYHNKEQRDTWDDAINAHEGIITKTSFYTNLIPPSARVIMVKAIDDFGVESSNAAVIYRPLGDVSAVNVVEEFKFHDPSPIWDGTLVGCSVDEGYLKADDTGELMYSGVPTALMYDGGNFYTATYLEMQFYAEFTVTSTGEMVVEIDFDGSGYELNIREVTSEVVPWQPVPERLEMTPGTYEIQLRVFGGPVRGIVRELSLIIDADDIEEDIQDVIIPSGGQIRVPITKNYSTIKIVSAIIQDTGGDDPVGYRLLDKDPTNGPLLEFIDSDGNPVDSGTFDATIKGY